MLLNKRGIVLITLIIWIAIIGGIVIYAPPLYNWYIEQDTIKIVKANVASVEKEIKSELIDTHPILIWNDTDNMIKSLNIQNPVTKTPQTKNGWNMPGDVAVTFNGADTFKLDGVGPDGNMLHLNIVIKG